MLTIAYIISPPPGRDPSGGRIGVPERVGRARHPPLEQAVAVQPANTAFLGNLAQVYLESMLALLALLDDYAGVCNTNMHLRAGTGRPARVLVPRTVEWRWMAAGETSPWFPGFRLYRQRMDGNWGAAFERLRKDLAAAHGEP